MSDFYQEMGQFVRDILQPTSAGGLGQGQITLTRITQGTPDPLEPWKPVVPQTTTQTLRGAAKGVSSRLVGAEVGGTIILASDREVITETPQIPYAAGDMMTIDGKAVHILDVQNIPAAGVVSAVKWVVR